MNLRILGPALLIVATSTPAFPEWTWVNPIPQGNYLHDIDYLSDQVVLAVGGAGTILRSVDGGTSWSIRSHVAGVAGALQSIAVASPTVVYVCGDGGTILKSEDAGQTWALLDSGTSVDLNDISFFGPNIGMAVGGREPISSDENFAIRTENGGGEWHRADLDAVAHEGFLYFGDVYGVALSSATTAIAVGRTTFMQTHDLGDTWEPRTLTQYGYPTLRDLYAVAYSDSLHGVVGGNLLAGVTNDGGLTWSTTWHVDTGHFSIILEDIEYNALGEILIGAIWPGTLTPQGIQTETTGLTLWSDDAGLTWDERYVSRGLFGVAAAPNGQQMVVGEFGTIYSRNEVDSEWQQSGGSPEYESLRVSAFTDRDHGILAARCLYCGANGGPGTRLTRTNDGWNTRTSWVTADMALRGLSYANSLLYGVGTESGRATIFKSLNDGIDWTEVWESPCTTNPPCPDGARTLTDIAMSSPGCGVVVGGDGVILHIAGDTAQRAANGLTGAIQDVDVYGLTAIAVTISRIAYSHDGGATWTLADGVFGGSFQGLRGVDVIDQSTAVAVGTGGVILLSHDAGVNWAQLASGTDEWLFGVGFADLTNGWAVGGNGAVFHTSNGGVSWSFEDSPCEFNLAKVHAFDALNAFVTSGVNVIALRTDPLPTLISSFDANARAFAVDLAWSVRDEADLAEFRIERTNAVTGASHSFRDIAASARSFQDDAVVPGAAYEYVLVAVDSDGSETYSGPVRVAVSQSELTLLPNVPNPFNPSTTIRYVLPSRLRVRVAIYDVAGRLVTTLVDREEAAGPYGVEWNGTGADGARVSSGVYLVRLEAGKQSLSRKIVLLK